MRKQANVSAIIQNALTAVSDSEAARSAEKTAAVGASYVVPLATELHKLASQLRALPQTPDVSVEDVAKFAQRLGELQ